MKPLHVRRDVSSIPILDLSIPKAMDTHIIPNFLPSAYHPDSLRYSPERTPGSPNSISYSLSSDNETPLNLSTTVDSSYIPGQIGSYRVSTDSSRSTNSPPKTPNTPSCYKKSILKRYGKQAQFFFSSKSFSNTILFVLFSHFYYLIFLYVIITK